MRDYAQLYLNAVEIDDVHTLIKDLIKENKQLHKENLYYKNIELHLKINSRQFELTFRRDSQPMSFDEHRMRDNNRMYFMTITFDPKRFDTLDFTSEESQKEYILLQLHKFKHKINFIYGCFEKHKNGVIHAHVLLNFNDYDIFREREFKKLVSKFTNSKYNKFCIDLQPVQNLDNVINYIDGGDKEKFGFFRYYNPINFLDTVSIPQVLEYSDSDSED